MTLSPHFAKILLWLYPTADVSPEGNVRLVYDRATKDAPEKTFRIDRWVVLDAQGRLIPRPSIAEINARESEYLAWKANNPEPEPAERALTDLSPEASARVLERIIGYVTSDPQRLERVRQALGIKEASPP